MTEPFHPSTGAAAAQFLPTHWSAVLQAGDQNSAAATDALGELCRVYWLPLYAFARRGGHSPEEAEDLTQTFFARLLEKNFVARADPAKGRFRTFLLTLFKRFLANEWTRDHAQKRGGFQQVLAIEPLLAESRLGAELAHTDQPDILFERQWAMTLLDQVMKRLEHEYNETGRARLFDELEKCLVRDAAALPYCDIAARLNLSEAAVKMAMQRLRARYQTILREQIRNTVSSPDDVEPELRELFNAFCH